MSSIFISYSHDRDDPKHAERVAGLAASLLSDGLQVFFDQNRGDEERVSWPIWMEDKIEVADKVLLVCTDLYLKKVRQQVAADEGRGVCWEANLIYNWLYERKLNTSKFIPVLLSLADEPFIPGPLKGINRFVLDSQAGYDRLYAFLTGQHRTLFPQQGATLQLIPQKTTRPLFGPAGKGGSGAAFKARTEPRKVAPVLNAHLTLRADLPPAPRQDVRGLDWYDECDAAHFLGREDDANRLLAMVLSHPVIRLIGPSGVGKSSLIRAGILPRIREFGWRACVIRPFENPAERVIHQLTAGLLANAGKFIAPLAPARFRAEVTPLLSAAGITRLVLLIDQFEDIVSPMADTTAVDSMREFLREIWEQREARPCLRAVIVYRTDADARLGRLWQEVSGRPEGLPYLALQGLSRDVAGRIIDQKARERGWNLETSVPGIVHQLAQESQALGCSGEVFPVYLQIFLTHAQQSADRHVTADSIAGKGGVSGLIGEYLGQTLARLKTRGGDWQHCGAILEALSRSAGTRAVQSLSDLVRETGLNRAVLAEILLVLINERLVRPVGHETYEIQHDRLAAAIIESMKDAGREAKVARDLLAAKVPTFVRTKAPLAHEDLVYLYRHRHQIHPTETELRIILASLVDERSSHEQDRAISPGWFWFRGTSPEEWFLRCAQVVRWAADEESPLRSFCLWQRIPMEFPDRTRKAQVLAVLREWARDQDWQLRALGGAGLANLGQVQDLPLLAELVKEEQIEIRETLLDALPTSKNRNILPFLRGLSRDGDQDSRLAALTSLVQLGEARDLIREYACDKNIELRLDVARIIADLGRAEFLPLLREMTRDRSRQVCLKALEGLATFRRVEDLPLVGELAGSASSAIRRTAAKVAALVGNAKALPLLRKLALDKNKEVRFAAVAQLARLGQAKDLLLISTLTSDRGMTTRARMVQVLASAGSAKVLPLLRQLARDENYEIRRPALEGVAHYGRANDVALIRELAIHRQRGFRLKAAELLGDFRSPTAVRILLGLAADEDLDVRLDALQALARSNTAKVLPKLRELVEDDDPQVRGRAVRILADARSARLLTLLRKLARDAVPEVRYEARKALLDRARPQDVGLFRELALDSTVYLSEHAARALAKNLSIPKLEAFLSRQDKQLSASALVVLDELLYMPEWLKEVDIRAEAAQED